MKTITVPKSKKAQALLDYDKCPEELLFEINLSKEEFDSLWKANFFTYLNSICNVHIDDYESEEITNQNSIALAIKDMENTKWPNNLKNLITEIIGLFIKAKKSETGVYFYF